MGGRLEVRDTVATGGDAPIRIRIKITTGMWVIVSCWDYNMAFCASWVAAKLNVTGVDWNGPEWTGVDILL
jgi:hypothetical protein